MTPLEKFKAVCDAATGGIWEWWTSCSWRRLGVQGRYGQGEHVLLPDSDSDNHPNLRVSDEDRELIVMLANGRHEVGALAEAGAALVASQREGVMVGGPKTRARWSNVHKMRAFEAALEAFDKKIDQQVECAS